MTLGNGRIRFEPRTVTVTRSDYVGPWNIQGFRESRDNFADSTYRLPHGIWRLGWANNTVDMGVDGTGVYAAAGGVTGIATSGDAIQFVTRALEVDIATNGYGQWWVEGVGRTRFSDGVEPLPPGNYVVSAQKPNQPVRSVNVTLNTDGSFGITGGSTTYAQASAGKLIWQ